VLNNREALDQPMSKILLVEGNEMNRLFFTIILMFVMAGVSAQSGGDAPKDYNEESDAPGISKDYNQETDAPKDYDEDTDKPVDL
jgi:hypothetical protein